MSKKPRIQPGLRPSEIKRPAIDPVFAGEAYPHRPLWKFTSLDLEGPWGWRAIEAAAIEGVLERLRSFETMTWGEIERKLGRSAPHCHPIEASELCKDARDRLPKVIKGEIPTLYSLRIAQLPRVWGYRLGRVFHFLWWDPGHSVCPTKQP